LEDCAFSSSSVSAVGVAAILGTDLVLGDWGRDKTCW
jgi:hypothetical protein